MQKPIFHPFKINGQRYQCPTSWDGISTAQFQELKAWNKTDLVKFLSIVTGVEYSILYNAREIEVVDKILPFLEFLKEPLTEKSCPKLIHVEIEGKQYKVPTDLGEYTYGQKIAASTRLYDAIEKTGDAYTCLSFIVAVYLQPLVNPVPVTERKSNLDTTGFSIEYAERFSEEVVDKMSIIETFNIGTFFLRTFTESLMKKKLAYPLNLIKNKKLLALIHSTLSKSSTRSTR